MQTPSHIRLHPERLAQLRMLAHAHSETVTETLERMISRELREDPLRDIIPGLVVMAGDYNILLSVGTSVHIGLTPIEAIGLAQHIQQIINGEDGKGRSLKARGFEIVFGRRGRALIVRLTAADGATAALSFTYSLAGDLQRQLANAAKYLADIHAA